ncbi:T5SS/PEP-CTERM-associated repeat protein [Bradyrhizobium sp. F1.13.1]
MPHLSFNRDAAAQLAPARSRFASRAASLMALMIGSTALTVVSLALISPASAGNPVWVGTISTDWFTAGNWNTSAVPNATDTVTIDTTTHLTFINGGTAAAQQTFVGGVSTGNLSIGGGGILNDAFGYLGYLQNSIGSVNVSGGSAWNNTADLSIGRLGAGNVGISGGSTVADVNASIGGGVGGSGSVTVAGAGSTWINAGDVNVGDIGTGSLTVINGASVITVGNSFIGNLGAGTATVTGAGSTWAAGANLLVGAGASGTLQVLQGGSVSATITEIGSAAGVHGDVTVDGVGSTLSTGTLTAGLDGIGQLTVSGGGHVNSTGVFLGYYGGSGTASVDGAGSIWTNTGTLTVGNAGTGTLTITNGAFVQSSGAISIGNGVGSTGNVRVDGAGSGLGLTSNANLSVGVAGIGTLAITNAGQVASSNSIVGAATGASGSVLVDGAGSEWFAANLLVLGGAGRGTLMLSNGGIALGATAVLGLTAGGSGGSAVIDGTGSSWTVNSLYVGMNTLGSLAVMHGGSLSNLNTGIGQSSGSNGSVTVDGAGSSWTNFVNITIGNAGTGSLTISNGGAVSAAGQFVIANQAGSTGALNIGAAPGSAAAAPGTLATATVQFGAGIGAINFNHSSSNYLFSPDIVGNGAVNLLSGTTILTGNNTYTGPTTVDGGTLLVNGTIASSTTTVNAGGTLGGIGIVGDTTISGGTLAPGTNAIGTLTIAGNLVLSTAATYMVQVSGISASNTVVAGAAQLAGTVAVNLTGRIAATTTYTILSSANTTGTFGSVAVSNLAYARNARVTYSGNNVLLTLDAGLLSPSLPGFANINQRNVAAGIDNALLSGASLSTGFNTLFNATGQNLLNRLTQASGEAATGAQQGTFNAMGQFLNAMLDPFFGGRNDAGAPVNGASRYAEGGAATRTNPSRDAYAAIDKARGAGDSFARRWSVWAAGYGGAQTTDGNAVIGSNTATSRIAGVAAGADYQISPNTLVGFALGGGGTSFGVANGLGGGSSDLFQAGVYARHTMGNAYVAGALAYGWQDVTTDRTVTIAGADHLRARFDANALSGRLEGGYRYATPWMGITPYAAAQFTTLFLSGYGEQAISGANTFALNYAGRDVTAARGELGLRTDRSYALETAVLTLRGRAAWAHDVNPDRAVAATFQTLPGASFVVNGAAQAPDAALLTGAAELRWLNGFSLSGTFESEFSSVTRSYAGKGIAKYQW